MEKDKLEEIAAEEPQANYREDVIKRTMLAYLAWTCFAIFFGFVYEIFGRGVWSFFMVYFFCIPLACGFIPSLLAYLKENPKEYPQRARWCWHAFVATASVGCILQGVMEIYGNFTVFVFAYPVAAVVLLILTYKFSRPQS